MNRRRRVIGWLACMTVAICSVGVPLPAQAVKKSGDPFPCQNCPCGCRDAETCWRDCCCHTNREKLDWAKQHGVKPPAFVIAAARRESCCSDNGSCCESSESKSKRCRSSYQACCEKEPNASCLATKKPARRHCAKCQEKEPATAEESPDHAPIGIVLLAAKLRCSGISLSVSLLPPSFVPRPQSISLEMPLLSTVIEMGSPQYESPYLAAPTPPPDRLIA